MQHYFGQTDCPAMARPADFSAQVPSHASWNMKYTRDCPSIQRTQLISAVHGADDPRVPFGPMPIAIGLEFSTPAS